MDKHFAIIDSDMGAEGDVVNEEERIANDEAADFCIPREKMRSFYVRKNPFFSDTDVRAFAKIQGVHPGLVVGQLHHITGDFRNLRHHLVAVRKVVTSSAYTDGWGHFVPVD